MKDVINKFINNYKKFYFNFLILFYIANLLINIYFKRKKITKKYICEGFIIIKDANTKTIFYLFIIHIKLNVHKLKYEI